MTHTIETVQERIETIIANQCDDCWECHCGIGCFDCPTAAYLRELGAELHSLEVGA